MIKKTLGVVAVAGLLATGAWAQSGSEVYKAKCAMCHGATGMADAGPGKAMKVKPVTDPSVKSMSAAAMLAATQNGAGKMPAYKGKLSDAEIKGAVDYFRTLIK